MHISDDEIKDFLEIILIIRGYGKWLIEWWKKRRKESEEDGKN